MSRVVSFIGFNLFEKAVILLLTKNSFLQHCIPETKVSRTPCLPVFIFRNAFFQTNILEVPHIFLNRWEKHREWLKQVWFEDTQQGVDLEMNEH